MVPGTVHLVDRELKLLAPLLVFSRITLTKAF